MNRLDPMELFERIARDVPQALHQHLFVTGSLAAALPLQGTVTGAGHQHQGRRFGRSSGRAR